MSAVFSPLLPTRTLDTPSGPVHTVDVGEGPPLVLLHGLGGLGREVAQPFLPMARRYRLLAPDRPGYGGTAALGDADMAPDRQAEWLAGFIEAAGLVRPTLVAHSLACAPALWLAFRRPDLLSGLVLVCPFCRPTPEAPMPLLRLAVSRLAGPLLRPLLPLLARWVAPSRLQAAFGPEPVPVYMHELPFGEMAKPSAVMAMAAELMRFNRAMARLAPLLREIRVRTVIVAGEMDEVASWKRHARWVARRLPNSAGACLRGAGHMAHHLRPAMVAAAVESARARRGRSPLRLV